MTAPSRILVEVCIESEADAITAAGAGADRLELCSALSLGGLTPSLATIEAVLRAVSLPLMVLVRPRPGGFCYSESEFAILLREIELAIDSGADGIVTGVLLEDGSPDDLRCRRLLESARGKPIVFHRAFDFTPRPQKAIEVLIEIGFQRVLTSGQRASALEGADLIRDLRAHAAGRIEILPGGGINADNVIDLLNRTGCDQVHASARQTCLDPSIRNRPTLALASSGAKEPNKHGITSEQRLRSLLAKLR